LSDKAQEKKEEVKQGKRAARSPRKRGKQWGQANRGRGRVWNLLKRKKASKAV